MQHRGQVGLARKVGAMQECSAVRAVCVRAVVVGMYVCAGG